uniref:Synaptogyrin 2b n=1 Tax=Gasterosteus aculeatus aculeatus TaxID=481459 RepID=A0AAQ4RQC3_GASAC
MEETGGASAYGASLAGGGFDFYKFVRQPQTIVRVLSWIFALVVFATITTEGYVNSVHSAEAQCIFNHNDSACHYAIGIGVIAFLACVAFLVLDVYLPFMSNAQERRYAVMGDLGFSGNPGVLCIYPFPPRCERSNHPDLHRAATRSAHPLPADLRPHLLQPHHLHPHHVQLLSQQCARHAQAAALHAKPAVAGKRRIPAAQLLRRREVTWTGSSVGTLTVVALHRLQAVSY